MGFVEGRVMVMGLSAGMVNESSDDVGAVEMLSRQL